MKKSMVIGLTVALAVLTVFSAFTVFATETVTNTQMLSMCNDADNYIDANGKVPQTIYTDSGHTSSVSAAEFYYMMSRWLRYYKNNSNTPPATVTIVRGTLGPPSPSGTESGTIQLADILAKGESNANFIDTNSQLPNYSTVGSTQYTTKAIFWVFDRTMQWYRDNGSMPTYATVRAVSAPTSWTGGPTPTPGPTPPVNVTLDAIGNREAQFADVQGQSDPDVMEQVGYGDCWASSGWLYNKVSAAHIAVRVMQCSDTGGLYYLHRWAEINVGNGWQVWDYQKYHSQHYGKLGSAPYIVIKSYTP